MSTTAYKGFDKGLKCRGFQYKLGETFIHNGEVKACYSGFHACENPLDAFAYYAPANSRYAEVTLDGELHRDGNDSKVAAARITITAELKIPELVSRAVNWVLNQIDHSIPQVATNTGYQSAATNTGDQSAATNTGYRSAATNTGYQSAATNTGYRSAATNTGYQSAATNTGDQSAATNTGYQSAATNTGDQSAATNTGDRSAASVEGLGAVALATGVGSKAKAAKGGAFCLVRRRKDGSVMRLVTGVVGRDGVKADTWYALNKRGQLKEVK